MSYPLDQVLVTNPQDFWVEHPERKPWHRPTLRRIEHAYTGNVRTVSLKGADQAQLRGLGIPSWDRDWLEPFDWTPAGRPRRHACADRGRR